MEDGATSISTDDIIHNGDVLMSLKPFYQILPMEHPMIMSPFPCLECRRRCDTLQELNMHRIWHRRENQCSICNRTFSSFEIFSAHIRKHYVDATKGYSVNNQIRENPVTCDFCPEKFTTLRDLQVHYKLYADSYSQCERCDQYLPSCHRHHDTVGSEDESTLAFQRKYYLNNLREKTFKTVGSLLAEKPKIHSSLSTFLFHTRAEQPAKPYTCDICKSRFGERSVLEQHLNDHYTEHELLYKSSSDFPHSARLKTKTGDKSHAYALTS